MNLNVPTKTARLTCGMRRSYQSMNPIQSHARSAIAQCKRFTQYLTSSLRVKGFTRQTRGIRHAVLTCGFTDKVDSPGTLQARALKGSERAASRIARSVALVIGISLSIPMAVADGGSLDAIQPKDYVRLALDKREAICL